MPKKPQDRTLSIAFTSAPWRASSERQSACPFLAATWAADPHGCWATRRQVQAPASRRASRVAASPASAAAYTASSGEPAEHEGVVRAVSGAEDAL